MPSFLPDINRESIHLDISQSGPYEPLREKQSYPSNSSTSEIVNGVIGDISRRDKQTDNAQTSNTAAGVNGSLHSLPNGRSSESTFSRDQPCSVNESSNSLATGVGGVGDKGKGVGPVNGRKTNTEMDDSPHGPQANGHPAPSERSKTFEVPIKTSKSPIHGRKHSASAPTKHARSGSVSTSRHSPSDPPLSIETFQNETDVRLTYRLSSPPIYDSPKPGSPVGPLVAPVHPGNPRIQHRHTLEVPKPATTRKSRDFSWSNPNGSEDAFTTSSHHTPATPSARRESLSLARRTTRSIHSDMYLDEIPQDGDVARWTETIRQKRASRRRRKEEEEDDRVMVGTKVDMHHVNWVTAYNMLTGIRFTVSRTNAKLDRELTDQDFTARYKFSFDITGNELTPSARYDFKFKDYAPWVFRRLRAKFKLDPGDYLMSLTSKYILSELGSPGKSGSFFYFSRDYKYIIKTIHHAEHKLLRKILHEYYAHVEQNPNTLISQFYGLHRVKIPYGRKIHFVVMNNLFPPHRDIHQTFDLKGSTLGRNFKEDDLERNPRATLKDLNWLRRNYHLEFGPAKKSIFVKQMERDVALLQKLNIMDYSLLVGIHDLGKGNEENLRDKTLQIFHPGGERSQDPHANMLMRTPSKLENARKARELRQIIKREKPVPMDKSTSKMPDEMLEEKKSFIFYSDDGGFRATHEDGQPGEEIYYLGIIDCLTKYGVIKKMEHFFKGMSQNKTQISAIPPSSYGERFLKFIIGITMSRERAEYEQETQPKASSTEMQQIANVSASFLDGQARSSHGGFSFRSSGDKGDGVGENSGSTSENKVLERAEKQAQITEDEGAREDESWDRTLGAVRSPSAERSGGVGGSTLPVVEEVGEGGSTGGRSGRSGRSGGGGGGEAGVQGGNNEDDGARGIISERRTLTMSPVQDEAFGPAPLGGRPPPTPPKDPVRDLHLGDETVFESGGTEIRRPRHESYGR